MTRHRDPASLGPGPEFPPGGSVGPDEPERCDFCTTRTLKLAGAMDFPLPDPIPLLRVDLVPLQLQPGLSGLELTIAPTVVKAGVWTACTVCAPVVAVRDPQLLADHVMAQWVQAGSMASLTERTGMLSLYLKLLPALGPPPPHIPQGAL
jgi:hypothetical protein